MEEDDRYTPSNQETGNYEDGLLYANEVADLPNFGDGEDSEGEDTVRHAQGDFVLDPELQSDGCQVCHPGDECALDQESGGDAKTGWTDQVKMIHLRRYVNQLAETIKDKDYVVNKTREELKKCKETMETLRKEKEVVEFQSKEQEAVNNITTVNRLKANHKRICQEIQDEEQLFGKIQKKLDQAEYELSKAQVEQGKYLLQEDELIKKEQKLLKEKTEQANYRNKKELKYAENCIYNDVRAKRERTDLLYEKQKTMHEAVEDAKRSLHKHQPYLQKTIAKMKQREKEEEKRQKEHLERRMETMLALKSDIAGNRENFRALLARNVNVAEEKKRQELEMVERIQAEGGNPDLELLKQKRLQQAENERKKFLAKKRRNEIKIAKKLVHEQESEERKHRLYPHLYESKVVETDEIEYERDPKIFGLLEEFGKQVDLSIEIDHRKYDVTGDESDEEEMAILLAGSGAQFFDAVENMPDPEDFMDEGNENMLQLEFRGAWDETGQGKQPVDPYSENTKYKGMTKHDKEIFEKRLALHKDKLTSNQKVAGKEFKGKRPFNPKPEIVHFKDFVVGETYTEVVVFTNVTYSINYLKLIDITENLKDFIEVDFRPPGQLSAGLTCEATITFKPMINVDLEGGINFLAQTGPLFLDIICTTKKIKLSVNTNHMDFGTTVIGETLKRAVTLTNSGALPVSYQFLKASDMQAQASLTITSLGGAMSQRSLITEDGGEEVEGEGEGKKKGEGEPGPAVQDTKGKSPGKGKPEDVMEEKKDKGKETLAELGMSPRRGTGEFPASATARETLGKGMDEEEEGEGKEEDDEEEEMDGGETSVQLEHMEDLADLDGMKVSSAVTSGELGAFSSVTMEVTWQPSLPGRSDNEFVFTFDNPACENITIGASGTAIDVPVWVPRPTVDLKICMYNRLYQDTVVVNNRASTALRLTFEVCPELRDHLELLPKTGYIQAQSQFTAQLKFLPKLSLARDAAKYFDKETGVFEAPLIIRVADQTKPVPFKVYAVVTTTDMVFDLENIDFGHCTIYESVIKKIKITNNSILPQRFGFTGLPEYVDIQPDDGFGTLLPLETLEFDVLFSPPRAGEYSFHIVLKSLIGREFKLQCRGSGVHPPLKLDKQIVHFKATAINDLHIAHVHLINSHTSMNEFKQPVPRIGSGEIAPVGETSFEFILPDDAPFSVYPSVGSVKPGEKKEIQLRFTPRIKDAEIYDEAVGMITRRLAKEAEEEQKRQEILEEQKKKEEAAKSQEKTKKGGKPEPKVKQPASPKLDYGPVMNVKEAPSPTIEPPTSDSIDKNSNDYSLAHTSLQLQFNGEFSKYMVRCYTASGECGKAGKLPYSVHNVLYMEVRCPARKPDMVVMSDSGRHTADFGDLSVGQRVNKFVSIQNVTSKSIKLKVTLLDPTGPFEIKNAIRDVVPFDSSQILLSFQPIKPGVFQESLKVSCGTSDLYLKVRGRAITPEISLTIPDGVYDMGCVLVGEYREEIFRIQNTSTLSVQYNIRMDSNDPYEFQRKQQLPEFIKKHVPAIERSKIGVQNHSGRRVFDAVPSSGIIGAGSTVEITVTFAPDHVSDMYSDGMRIDLFGKPDQHVLHLIGRAKQSVMYMKGGEELEEYSESLMPPADWRTQVDITAQPPPLPAMIVHLYSVNKNFEFLPTSRDVYVGCVRTMAVSQKKQGEWQFDDLKPIQQLGFNIEPPKGWIEAGTEKPLTITWQPNFDSDPSITVDASINCTLRGDFTETQKIILRGFIISPDGAAKIARIAEEREKRRPKTQKEIEEISQRERELEKAKEGGSKGSREEESESDIPVIEDDEEEEEPGEDEEANN